MKTEPHSSPHRRFPFPFALLLVTAVTAMYAADARANAIVFDTMPSNTYDQNGGYGIGPGITSEAAQFTAAVGGTLATVDLGLTFEGSAPGAVNVFLYGDAAGLPDNANQTLLGSGIPTAAFGSSNNSIVSFSVLGNVPVTMGSLYWLVLKPADPATDDVWNISSPAIPGATSFTTDGSTWNGPFRSDLPAFRLTVQNGAAGVPDSAPTCTLLLMGITATFGLKFLVRRLA